MSNNESESGNQPLDTTGLTWAALLGQWVEFARSSVGLPDTQDGQRMRDSVGDVIMLQAVWFALQQLDGLAVDEVQLGLDRAELLIDKHGDAIHSRWDAADRPAMLDELIVDARTMLATSRAAAESPDASGTPDVSDVSDTDPGTESGEADDCSH